MIPCLEYGWACSDFLKRSLTISFSRSLGSRLLFNEERYVPYFYLVFVTTPCIKVIKQETLIVVAYSLCT